MELERVHKPPQADTGDQEKDGADFSAPLTETSPPTPPSSSSTTNVVDTASDLPPFKDPSPSSAATPKPPVHSKPPTSLKPPFDSTPPASLPCPPSPPPSPPSTRPPPLPPADGNVKAGDDSGDDDHVIECATTWSILAFAISTCYTCVEAAFAFTGDDTYTKFYAPVLLPTCSTAMCISFVLKPRRNDFRYTAFLYTQYLLFTLCSEALIMTGERFDNSGGKEW